MAKKSSLTSVPFLKEKNLHENEKPNQNYSSIVMLIIQQMKKLNFDTSTMDKMKKFNAELETNGGQCEKILAEVLNELHNLKMAPGLNPGDSPPESLDASGATLSTEVDAHRCNCPSKIGLEEKLTLDLAILTLTMLLELQQKSTGKSLKLLQRCSRRLARKLCNCVAFSTRKQNKKSKVSNKKGDATV